MTDIRAPYAYSILQEKGVSKEKLNELGFKRGYWVSRQLALEAAEELGVDKHDLLINSDELVNQRFKSKLRGSLTSYLFEYSGAFRYSASINHMRIIGVEKVRDIALPTRVMDALLLERTLHQIIARSRYMLTELNSRFAASEQAVVFSDQKAPGLFKPRSPYKQKTNDQ